MTDSITSPAHVKILKGISLLQVALFVYLWIGTANGACWTLTNNILFVFLGHLTSFSYAMCIWMEQGVSRDAAEVTFTALFASMHLLIGLAGLVLPYFKFIEAVNREKLILWCMAYWVFSSASNVPAQLNFMLGTF